MDAASPYAVSLFARARQAASPRPGEIVSLPSRAEVVPQPGDDPRQQAKPQDWASAIELVQEASEAIRIGQERADELETKLDEVIAQASEEVRQLTSELASAEERLRAAEARAKEAETGLARLYDAVTVAFGAAPEQPRAGDARHRPREAPAG